MAQSKKLLCIFSYLMSICVLVRTGLKALLRKNQLDYVLSLVVKRVTFENAINTRRLQTEICDNGTDKQEVR